MNEWIESAKKIGLQIEEGKEAYYVHVGKKSNLMVLEVKSRKGLSDLPGGYLRKKQLYHFYFKYDDCFHGYDEVVVGDERLILSGLVLGPGSLHPEHGPTISLNAKSWTPIREIPMEMFTKFYRKMVEDLLVD